MAYEVVQLPREEAEARGWIPKYKTLRLHALKTEPQFFGSTYEREVVWEDDVWLTRLMNPDAVTFVTLYEGNVVGALTAVQITSGADE